MNEVEPRYIHDCDECKLICWYLNYDLYLCGEDNLVARYGDKGSEYASVTYSDIRQGTLEDAIMERMNKIRGLTREAALILITVDLMPSTLLNECKYRRR